jgi:RIO kinase 1
VSGYRSNFDEPEDSEELDKYEVYAEQFNPLRTDKEARRKRKAKVNHVAKKSTDSVIEELADEVRGTEGSDFTTTYTPARYEKGWLYDSVRSFYSLDLITDVLGQVKGGKEASVYRCEGHPATGQALLAAKVYRPRQFRNLRNDAMYRQGREVLKGDGRAVKKTDQRIARAVGKKSAFGVQVQHTSWLMYEYTTLERLHTAGAAVPKPWGVNDNAIMMEYIGDEYEAGPALNEVRLDPDEVEPLFRETLRNIELMLNMNLIHGDLSAYNILYWDGKITLIDFPQVSNSRANDKARFILGRDITRVCQYFSGQGLDCDAEAILNDMWQRNVAVGPDEVAAEESLHLMDADYWLADDEEDD